MCGLALDTYNGPRSRVHYTPCEALPLFFPSQCHWNCLAFTFSATWTWRTVCADYRNVFVEQLRSSVLYKSEYYYYYYCSVAIMGVEYCDDIACPSVRLWSYLWNYPCDLYHFLCTLPMTVARSSSVSVAIHYVLPFARIVPAYIAVNDGPGACAKSNSPVGTTGGRVCSLWLQRCYYVDVFALCRLPKCLRWGGT